MRFKKIWEFLTGNSDDFALDNRIFNSVSVFTLTLLTIFLLANLALGFYELVALSAVLWSLQVGFYYFSRIKRRYKSSFIAYAVVSYLAVAIAFFYNSGSQGPALFIFFLTFHLLIAFTPRKSHVFWVLGHLVVTLTVLTIEYLHPEWVPYLYATARERYLDFSVTYVFILAFIYFATIYLRNMLSKEKRLAENRAREIEGFNIQILEQNQALEQLNQEKNKMFSVVSHDLRSPLDSITGYLELLSSETLDAAQKLAIERELLSLTKSTSDMLSNLLSWSKSQMEGMEINLVLENIYGLLTETLEAQKLIANKKRVNLSYDIAEDVEAIVDKDMLQLVVRNLVNNAVKFTPSGGSISVICHNTAADCRLMIKDNGMGISQEQQKELFSLKSKSTYGTSNEKGVGLGLLLCKEFIELQNGRIWFISSPGIGTTFFISLPLP